MSIELLPIPEAPTAVEVGQHKGGQTLSCRRRSESEHTRGFTNPAQVWDLD
ncbi:MAG: hypothetical protein DHS20C13_27300 [Thermodesulfobacteriota bacterium]|nr:MAG: hypothetical protein DHS20C13_27300 [Thermodesulfobacteriota bacterium]